MVPTLRLEARPTPKRLAACEDWIASTGALAIHAFDQTETMLGQGSVGRELEEQAPDLDTVLVAVGGGGLIAGIAAWYEGRTRILGVEPRLAPTLSMALEAGRPVDAPAVGHRRRLAGTKRIGERVFPIVRRHVAGCCAGRRQRHCAGAARALGNGAHRGRAGAAAPLAALLSGAYVPAKGERVGIVVSGANTTAVAFS